MPSCGCKCKVWRICCISTRTSPIFEFECGVREFAGINHELHEHKLKLKLATVEVCNVYVAEAVADRNLSPAPIA